VLLNPQGLDHKRTPAVRCAVKRDPSGNEWAREMQPHRSVGLLGYAVTDNGAHLGGFLNGAGIAFAIVDKKDDGGAVVHETRLRNWIGWLSLATFIGACALSLVLIWQAI
jgi:hypothetical protein